MDPDRFDALARALTATPSRRAHLRGLVAIAASLGAPGLTHIARAGKGKGKKKLKLNEFGCVNVGGKCRGQNDVCCSGICQGKKKKKSRCAAHDASTCRAGQDACGGLDVECITTNGQTGKCLTTTGNAGYCTSAEESDIPCQKDDECITDCGAGAACIVCGQGPGAQSLCIGLDSDCGQG